MDFNFQSLRIQRHHRDLSSTDLPETTTMLLENGLYTFIIFSFSNLTRILFNEFFMITILFFKEDFCVMSHNQDIEFAIKKN